MAIFLQWTLPMPVVAAPQSTEDLPTMLTNAFGASPNGWDHFWITYYPASQLAAWDFSYWNLASRSVASWYVNGADIGGGFNNQRFVPGNSIATAVLHAGNDIGPLAYVTVPTSGAPGSYAEYIQYSIITIDPHVLSPVAGHGEPTPQDIVDSAYRFANYFGPVPNDNDCHFIAAAVAAATGSTLTDSSLSLDPTQNEDGGFWRIVYRGSDPNPVSHWQTLVHPGDIVRMGWTGGGQHTTTVLSVNPDNSIIVYDNADPDGHGGSVIGVHTVYYDQQTIPTTITIYRLATDGLYLENGTSLNETLPGTIFNDHVMGFGGNDNLSGGGGNDRLEGGSGNDTLKGGEGTDTAVFSGHFADYAITPNGTTHTVTVADQRGGTPDGIDTLQNIEVLQFADGTAKYDVTQSAPWASQVNLNDAGGHLASQTVTNDNGTHWTNTFDAAGTNSWTWQVSASDPGGHVTSQVVTNDDGTHTLTIFDVANAYPWAQATVGFNAHWHMTSVTGTRDDGSHAVTMLDIAAAYDTLLWFPTPYDPNWNKAFQYDLLAV